MSESPVHKDEVYSFVLDQIETVPHLEALLVWNSRPQPWTVENLAKRLYVSTDIVDVLLEDLGKPLCASKPSVTQIIRRLGEHRRWSQNGP
jgi:hypothetical protein